MRTSLTVFSQGKSLVANTLELDDFNTKTRKHGTKVGEENLEKNIYGPIMENKRKCWAGVTLWNIKWGQKGKNKMGGYLKRVSR